jgi:2-methylcitrate dehydratase PrpD
MSLTSPCLAADASLSEGLLALCSRPFGPADLDAAALHLLDWLGCALGGAASPTGRQVASLRDDPAAEAHPLALAGTGGAESAAILGALGSLLEMDDVHRGAILHPGPVVCAAALALPVPQSGEALLAAILAGYEAMIRLGAAVGPGHYALFHNTGTCGGIGAAVAAARLTALGPEATVWAMGHAASLSAGLWQCRNEPGATKHLHVSEAARRGVQAARAAGAGIMGPRLVLEGPQGFFAALAPAGRPGDVLADPERPWQLHDTSFKPWPACRHAHPAIDAALSLRPRLEAPPRRIRIETYSDAVLFCDKPTPRNPAEARFSLQHAVAIALSDGPPTLAAFDTDDLDRPAWRGLRDCTEVAADVAFSARYPAHFGARVTVLDASGATLAAETPDAWGDTENPMSRSDVIAKFRMLASAADIPEATASAIETATLALSQGGAADPLIAALRRLPPPST